MNRATARRYLLTLAALASSVVAAAEFENVGHAGANFLQIPVDAQGAALANANVAMVSGARGLSWNPGAIALSGGREAVFSYASWLADTRVMHAGVVMGMGSLGFAGLSVSSLSMDDMEATTEVEPDGTGEYFGAGDMAIGLSYGYQVSDRFSWGLTAKYVHEYIWDTTSSALSFDVGSVYRADVLNLRIGMIISNFGGELTMEGDQIDDRLEEEAGQDIENNPQEERLSKEYSLPQYFTLGVAVDPWATEDHAVTVLAAANDPNDNNTRLGFGLQYGYRELLFLRAGLKTDYEEQGFSAGAGFKLGLGGTTSRLDYAFTDFGVLESVHHITYSVAF